MSSEPDVTARKSREAAFRLLCLNHTFTSYISALGAHREQLTNPDVLALLDDAVCYVDDALHHQPADEAARHTRRWQDLKQRIQQLEPRPDSKEPLVVQQVGLLIALLPGDWSICSARLLKCRQRIPRFRRKRAQPTPPAPGDASPGARLHAPRQPHLQGHRQNLLPLRQVILPQSQPAHLSSQRYATSRTSLIPASPSKVASR